MLGSTRKRSLFSQATTDHGGVATPLRGEKGTTWEGGLRIPAIFRWPGKIEPDVIDGMAANLDLYATFAALSEATDLPTSSPGFISKDLTGILLSGASSPRRQWLYEGDAFRSGKYKIHMATKDRSSSPDTRKREPKTVHNPPLLFDLEADMSETTNIGAENPEIVARLLRKMNAFKKPAKK